MKCHFHADEGSYPPEERLVCRKCGRDLSPENEEEEEFLLGAPWSSSSTMLSLFLYDREVAARRMYRPVFFAGKEDEEHFYQAGWAHPLDEIVASPLDGGIPTPQEVYLKKSFYSLTPSEPYRDDRVGYTRAVRRATFLSPLQMTLWGIGITWLIWCLWSFTRTGTAWWLAACLLAVAIVFPAFVWRKKARRFLRKVGETVPVPKWQTGMLTDGFKWPVLSANGDSGEARASGPDA